MPLIYHLFIFVSVVLLSEVLVSSATMPSKDRARKNKKKDINKSYYEVNKDAILSDRKDKYVADERSNRHNEEYYRKVASSRVKSAESSKVHYHKDLDKSRVISAENF